MSGSIWREFADLLGAEPVLIGTVTAIRPDGTSAVQLPDGTTIIARGTSVAVNSNAYIQGGAIQGSAPTLPIDTITLY